MQAGMQECLAGNRMCELLQLKRRTTCNRCASAVPIQATMVALTHLPAPLLLLCSCPYGWQTLTAGVHPWAAAAVDAWPDNPYTSSPSFGDSCQFASLGKVSAAT